MGGQIGTVSGDGRLCSANNPARQAGRPSTRLQRTSTRIPRARRPSLLPPLHKQPQQAKKPSSTCLVLSSPQKDKHRHLGGHPKVGQLDQPVLGGQDVSALYVAVHYALVMQKSQALQEGPAAVSAAANGNGAQASGAREGGVGEEGACSGRRPGTVECGSPDPLLLLLPRCFLRAHPLPSTNHPHLQHLLDVDGDQRLGEGPELGGLDDRAAVRGRGVRVCFSWGGLQKHTAGARVRVSVGIDVAQSRATAARRLCGGWRQYLSAPFSMYSRIMYRWVEDLKEPARQVPRTSSLDTQLQGYKLAGAARGSSLGGCWTGSGA